LSFLSHSPLVEPLICRFLSCCSTISLLLVLSLIYFLWSLANGCFLNGIEGVRIPCCANFIQMQIFYLFRTLGSFHISFKAPFAVIIVFDFTWYHFVLNNIKGAMIPYLCTLYFNSNGICCAQTLGSFFTLFRTLFWSSHNIFIWFAIWIFWLLSSFVGSLSIMSYYFVCNLWSLI
jgi:hypothetical protein